MDAQPPRVFVIRIWIEPGTGGRSHRGYVEHIATGRRRYFVRLPDICDFIGWYCDHAVLDARAFAPSERADSPVKR